MKKKDSKQKEMKPDWFMIGLYFIGVAILLNTLVNFSLIQSINGAGFTTTQPSTNQPEPEVIRFSVNENTGQYLGPKDSKIVVYEFSDLQCPACASAYRNVLPSLKKLADEGKIKLVFKHFPLRSIHALAQKMGEATECAGTQSKFWEYHDTLFEKQEDFYNSEKTDYLSLTDAILIMKQYAETLNLNTEQFNSCLDNGDKASIVNEQYNEATSLGLGGTPSFLVNGIILNDIEVRQKGRLAVITSLIQSEGGTI